MASSSTTYSNPPCAACKFLRRKCLPTCIFAPYFPPQDPFKFLHVHKIFGASNVSKLLHEIPPHQREDAVKSLAYEAEARLKDPVFGCVGAISVLQRQVINLQRQLNATNADLRRYTMGVEQVPFDDMDSRFHNHQNHDQDHDQYGDGTIGMGKMECGGGFWDMDDVGFVVPCSCPNWLTEMPKKLR